MIAKFCAAAYKDSRPLPQEWRPEHIVLIDTSTALGREKEDRDFAIAAAEDAFALGVTKVMFFANHGNRADLMGRRHFAHLKQEGRTVCHGLSLVHAFHALKAGDVWYDAAASHRHIIVVMKNNGSPDGFHGGDAMTEVHAAQVLRCNPRTTLDFIQCGTGPFSPAEALAAGTARSMQLIDWRGQPPGWTAVAGAADVKAALRDTLDRRMKASLLERLAEVSAARANAPAP